ncbi:MAG: 23S rRNA (adenine(2503)-C(2))-methyltransferase RlmN [Candidatus Eisenbacteria bacterium]
MESEMPQNLIGLSSDQIAGLPEMAGQPRFRASQIVTWIYQRGAVEFDSMANLPKALRARLALSRRLDRLPVLARQVSADHSARKVLFALDEGERIEAVLLRAPRRDTLCISTQAGCRFGCRFCATGAMGWRRNLSVHEVVSQVLVLREELLGLGHQGFFNLVFMGMGEPLDNYDTVVAAIRVLHEDFGLALGYRRVTVSTVGLPDQIRRLAGEQLPVRLAWSLNATDNETRSSMMPVNRLHPIEAVLSAMAEYRRRTGSRTTLEYILIDGVNDSLGDARRLARMAGESDSKVNLIRLNAHGRTAFRPSPIERVRAFYETMLPLGPAVTLRESRGADIFAACGQLSTAYETGGAIPGSMPGAGDTA